MFGSDKFSTPEPHMNLETDGVKYTQYIIGSWEVRIAEDGGLSYRRYRHHSTDVHQLLPSFSLEDRQLVIDVEDLVSLILERMPPAELAQTLWAEDDQTRKAFIELFVERYESGFSDQDRRDFLKLVREAVHDSALDVLINLLSGAEYNFGKIYFTHDKINQINRTLEHLDIKDQSGKQFRIQGESQDPLFKIGGEAWHEARDSWREEVRKLFPA